jgi:hypothetical protein
VVNVRDIESGKARVTPDLLGADWQVAAYPISPLRSLAARATSKDGSMGRSAMLWTYTAAVVRLAPAAVREVDRSGPACRGDRRGNAGRPRMRRPRRPARAHHR